ncbi:MAG: hypothetical protein HRT35_14310 [Algicola sp.]|nr:hypothetical protein [Algicola sp.]
MKSSKISKIILALGLGLGLSTAYAVPHALSCSELGAKCNSGNSQACYDFDRYKCNVCELDPSNC